MRTGEEEALGPNAATGMNVSTSRTVPPARTCMGDFDPFKSEKDPMLGTFESLSLHKLKNNPRFPDLGIEGKIPKRRTCSKVIPMLSRNKGMDKIASVRVIAMRR